MMTINKLIKNLLGVNKIKAKSVEYTNTKDGCKKIIVDVELYKSEQCRPVFRLSHHKFLEAVC